MSMRGPARAATVLRAHTLRDLSRDKCLGGESLHNPASLHYRLGQHKHVGH